MRVPLLENGQLLAKSEVFKKQVATRATNADEENNHEPQQAQQETSLTWEQLGKNGRLKGLNRQQIGILARHSAGVSIQP
jgi:hypothetical protein